MKQSDTSFKQLPLDDQSAMEKTAEQSMEIVSRHFHSLSLKSHVNKL